MGLHLGLQYIVRRISIRDAEILSVGKIAEFTKFAGDTENRNSLFINSQYLSDYLSESESDK